MRIRELVPLASMVLLLAACGSSGGTAPGAPVNVSVASSGAAGTATVSFSAPTSGDPATAYVVTAMPGAITATGASSPITLTGLAARTAYTFSVVAANASGASAPATTHPLRFYSVVETFTEPMTAPNDSIFTGTFTFDTVDKGVSNLRGSLTQAMTKQGTVYGPPMTEVAIAFQMSSTLQTVGGVEGQVVAAFALETTNVFDPGGYDPANANRVYYGLAAGAPNPKMGGVGNANVVVFVNTADPTATPAQAQLDVLAYADCTAGGMMMNTCMTGTTLAGYGHKGTMMGVPTSLVVTER